MKRCSWSHRITRRRPAKCRPLEDKIDAQIARDKQLIAENKEIYKRILGEKS